ncbi:50S ribosomal protein L9 [Sporanaerobium hydrogeniformans]|uniref:50S ribosomal protein L9 n=1 Tax=Sporanaerobium hydrogeniformans TaxID=3072179 RepID=A0AC61D9D3_9FIRM|nr:50S ribosomal protein L9 [Sporanaerobium hydrogeniformans]PHV69217.1 50S ribosomal protein L9 [Sporanaerobium hydrogeniformans]
MKVILTQDVKKVGKKGDMLEVKDGYARNALFPKGLAVEANAVNINQRKLEQRAEDKRKQQELDNAKGIEEKLKDKTIKIGVKVGEGGKVFGSVTSKEIAEAIQKECGVEVDKKKIQLKDAIKGLGGQAISIKLHPAVTATITVLVVEA